MKQILNYFHISCHIQQLILFLIYMIKKQLFNQLKQMGFSQQAIQKAAKISRQKGGDIYDILTNPSKQNSQQKSPQGQIQIYKTFLKSRQQIKFEQYECIYNQNQNNFEFQKDDQRQEGIPIALKNVSNCCYLNSLLQAYFLMPKFVEIILNAIPLQKQQLDNLILNHIRNKRVSNSYNLLRCLQQVFSNMILSTKRYIDPSNILKNLVDSVGNKITYGQQKDLSEINLQFVSRLQQCTIYVQSNFSNLKSSQYINQSPQKQINFQSTVPQVKSQLKSLLFGEKVQLSNNNDETKIESQFFGILLNPIHGNLYKALDQQFHFNIQQGETKIKKDFWITKSPDYLFFYIQRTGYDKKKGVVKMKDKIKFEFQIYLDRYMYKNKDKQIDKNPVLIQNIQNRDSVTKQINHTKALIKSLNSCHYHNSFLKSPLQLPDKQSLINYLGSLEQQLQQCQINISKLQSRLQKYSLRYIIVHRGEADSGHYWGYGYSGNWWRYDLTNSKIEKQAMMKQIQNGDVVVYALVYTKVEQKFFPSFNLFLKDEYFQFFEQPKNYNHMVSQKVKQKILSQNLRRLRIHEQKKLSQSISQITLEYQQRFKIVNQMFLKYKQKHDLKYPIINNFSAYLRSSSQQVSNLLKYHLLDLSLKSFTKYSILQIPNDNYIKQLLTSFKENLNKSIVPDKIRISNTEYKTLMDKFQQFKLNLKANAIIQIMLKNIDQKKWIQAIEAAYHIIKFNIKNYYQQIAQQFLAVLIILLIFQNKPVNKEYLVYFQKSQVKYYQQINKLTQLINLPRDPAILKNIEEITNKQVQKQLYVWQIDRIESENFVDNINQSIKKSMQQIGKYVQIYIKIIKSDKILTKEQLTK